MMDFAMQLLHQLYDVEGLIQWGGLVMLTFIVFTETGLMFGFFLPGDSLLVTAGVFAAAGHLNFFSLTIILSIAAVAGDQLGYWIGASAGPRVFNREDSIFFHKRHAERAQQFYDRHGGKTIILARFIPVIRTFAPVIAGVGQMEYGKFVLFNVVGGVGWVWGLISVGFALGRSIPNIDRHIHLVILIVIFLSILPGIIEFAKSWLATRRVDAT